LRHHLFFSPDSAGLYEITFEIDADDRIAVSDETNNRSTISLTATVQ